MAGRAGERGRARLAVLAICVAAVLAPAPAFAATGDPFEPLNRAFFGLHQQLDHLIIRPLAVAYVRIIPKVMRKGFSNVFGNLGEPAVFVNDVLQAHPQRALKTLTRFAGNSTFGVVGLFDVATPAGLPHRDNDFGITLAHWGVPSGPYLFIPVAGPGSVRDGFGQVVGLALNPLVYLRFTGDKAVGPASVISTGLQARMDGDSQLKALFASATDPYASFRSFYVQNRESQISGGTIDLNSLPDFGADPSGPPAAPSVAAPVPTSAETDTAAPPPIPVASPASATAAAEPAPIAPPAATSVES